MFIGQNELPMSLASSARIAIEGRPQSMGGTVATFLKCLLGHPPFPLVALCGGFAARPEQHRQGEAEGNPSTTWAHVIRS